MLKMPQLHFLIVQKEAKEITPQRTGFTQGSQTNQTEILCSCVTTSKRTTKKDTCLRSGRNIAP